MVQQRGQGPGGRGPINVKSVNVERATVARADVTRMSMDGDSHGAQEDLLEDIKERLTGGDSIKSSVEGVRSAIIDCCKAATGGGDGAAALNAANMQAGKSGDAFTKTLEGLQKSMEVLINATQQMSVSAGESGQNIEAGGGLALAQQKAQQKQFEALSNMMFRFEKVTDETSESGSKLVLRFGDLDDNSQTLSAGFSAIGESLKEVRMAEYVKFLNQATQTLEGFVSELTDVTKKMREVVRQFKEDMDTSRSGLITTFDLFTSEIQNIGNLFGGELTDSTRMVIEAVQRAGGAPGLMTGRTLEEQAKTLHDIRGEIETSRFRTLFGFEKMNDSIIEQLEVARRRGLQGEQAELFAEKRSRQELDLMANIMQNTGMTADAVGQLIEKQRAEFENLVAGGAVNERQRELLMALRGTTMGQSEWGEKMMTEMMASRFSIVTMDEGMRTQLQALGVLDDYDQIQQRIRDGSLKDKKDIVAAFNALGDQVAEQEKRYLGDPSREAQLKALGLNSSIVGGLANDLRGLIDVTGDPGKDTGFIVAALDRINEFLKKYFPTALGGLAVAMVAHTAAMVAHTFALLKGSGGLGGLFGKKGRGGFRGPMKPVGKGGGFPRAPMMGGPAAGAAAGGGRAAGGLGKALGIGGKALGGVARVGGSALGMGFIAKDVYDLATGDTSGDTVGGLAGGGVGALIGGGIGALFGGVGAVPGAMIGAGIGNWLGGMAGEAVEANKEVTQQATQKIKEAGPGPSQTNAMMEQAVQQGQMSMAEQTSLLQQISTLLTSIDRSNTTVAEKIGGIGQFGIGGKLTPETVAVGK